MGALSWSYLGDDVASVDLVQPSGGVEQIGHGSLLAGRPVQGNKPVRFGGLTQTNIIRMYWLPDWRQALQWLAILICHRAVA